MQINISQTLNIIITFAREEAMRTGSYGIAPDHLFLGIIRHGSNPAAETLKELGTDLQELKQFIDKKIFTNEHIPYSEIDHISLSRGAQNVLNITFLECARLRTSVADAQHLLLALSKISQSYGQIYLKETGIDYGRLVGQMERSGYLEAKEAQSQPMQSDEPEEHRTAAESKASGEDQKEERISIEDYIYDLTEAARKGLLDPVVGRETEIERVVEILGRRKKNNAMLVGDPGVGKSAIVEGIALRIASGDIPGALRGKRLVSLDIASVVAGTRYRGDFEKRLKGIIRELKDNPDIILFIDEFHTIVGAGGASGSLDAANMLKPALARGEIQCIGATTMDEFTKVVEKDGALDRRFQKVTVFPADVNYSISILKKLKFNYEQHHNVVYGDDAVEACVRLSERYITDKCLPDKAIDALDEAGSMVRMKSSGKKAVSVTAEHIAEVISKMSGVPVTKVAESEAARLVSMNRKLREKVVGQDEAIDRIVRAIQRSRAGIKDPNRPVGSFLFLGPTGVGKTRLAKCLAEELFDSQDNIIRIDMSEYMEKINVSRLIGAPPGYVGFEEGGQLSERVRRNPYSVVLLDEIEKAHPDVFNLLLQVLDEGRLTDSNGRVVNFRNTILIMTSNIGSRELEDYGHGIGFEAAGKNIDTNRKAVVDKAIKKAFSPEFINRIDEQIYFKQLERQDIERIIDIELKQLRKRVADAGYRLHITPGAKCFIASEGFDPKYGARPLRRAIQNYVENPVAEFIISATLNREEKAEGTALRICLNRSKDDTVIELK